MADAATDDSEISTDHPMNKIYLCLHPFELSSTTDMVSHNKGTKKKEDHIARNVSAFIVTKLEINATYQDLSFVAKCVRNCTTIVILGHAIINQC